MRFSINKLWFVLGLLFLGIQFVPANRSSGPAGQDLDEPEDVRAILRRSCYDCHSNETKWPWYSRVAPVSWLVASDVRKGRREMNFSEWANFSEEKKTRKRESILEEVTTGEMPLWYYVLLHPKAKLSPDDVSVLTDWVEQEGRADTDEMPEEIED